MAEYRRASARELPEITDFINMVFSMSHQPHDFKVLLPKAYADDACMAAEHFIARENGRIEGVVGLLPVRMRILGEELRAGVVGSVSAHPYSRGAGHMRGCMNEMLKGAKALGMELLTLGGNRQRYEYFGFSKGGVVMEFSLRDANIKHGLRDADAGAITFGAFDEHEAEAAALFSENWVSADRSAGFSQIARTYCQIPHGIYKNGSFAGYLISSGDGQSISEIGLRDEADFAAVIKAWAKYRALERLSIEIPVWMRERVAFLSRISQNVNLSAATMFRIEDFPKNLRLWLSLKAKYARLQPGRLVLCVEDGESISIEVSESGVRVENTKEAPEIRLTRLEAQDWFGAPYRWFDTRNLPAFAESWFPLPINGFRADEF